MREEGAEASQFIILGLLHSDGMFTHGNIDPCSSIKPSECWSKHQLHFFVARCVRVITIHWSGDWINHNTAHPGLATQTSDAASKDRPYAALTRNWLDWKDDEILTDLTTMAIWFVVVCSMMSTVHTIHISCECCVSWLSIVFTVIASSQPPLRAKNRRVQPVGY